MDEKVLDSKTINMIRYQIFIMEKNNVQTKKYSDKEMVDKIKKYIKEEVDRNDN